MTKKQLLVLVLFVSSLSVFSQNKIENLMVHWPEEYKWKIGTNQEDEIIHFMELVPEKESIENWTIIGTMMSLKNVTGMPMDKAMNFFFDQTKTNAPEAKLTLIEKNETEKNHWVLFKVEVEKYLDDPKPESQLYYIIQGESSLYVNLVGIKEKKISKPFETKWSAIFKGSKIVFQ